jgi:type IV fimbrial biogenesis protein FimT
MKSRGFTLIELMIVIALMAVLTSLAVPGFSQFLSKRSVSAAAATLATDYRFARSEAIKRASFVTVCRSTDSTSCAGVSESWHGGWIVFADTDGNGVVGANEDILRVQQVVQGISSMANPTLSSTRHTATFRSSGIAVSVSDTMVITPSVASTNTRLMCISWQGRVALRSQGDTLCD